MCSVRSKDLYQMVECMSRIYRLIHRSSRSGSASSHLGHHSPGRLRDTSTGVGGPCGLWHFMYRSLYLDQYISSEFSAPINTAQQQKRLYRAYQKIYASMHDKGFGPHKTQFRQDENYVLLWWVTPDFELYAAFDPLADKIGSTTVSVL